jgi:predicted  nucleic acid-binding Zn-ribbon protein
VAQQTIAADRTKLEGQLADLRAARQQKANQVAKPLLSTYDRIRSKKRVQALYPMTGASCGNCDTAIPLQRRTQMMASGKTELCEGCGVLLYAEK